MQWNGDGKEHKGGVQTCCCPVLALTHTHPQTSEAENSNSSVGLYFKSPFTPVYSHFCSIESTKKTSTYKTNYCTLPIHQLLLISKLEKNIFTCFFFLTDRLVIMSLF